MQITKLKIKKTLSKYLNLGKFSKGIKSLINSINYDKIIFLK